jgi:DNA-directed RNA polymerase subunit omega
LNAELLKKAAEQIGNPNILVNLVSRRVRQLNAGGGALSRPLLSDTTGMGAADIAMTELVEDKLGWELTEPAEAQTPGAKRRKRP